jgi:O-antigen/teichoic acid export membrane protein
VLGQQAEAAEVGHFLAAQRLNEVFLEIATAVSLVMFSRVASKAKTDGRIDAAVSSVPWVFWSYFVVAAITYFATPLVIVLLLGSAYIGSIKLLQIIVWGLPAAAVVKVLNGALAGAGLPKLSAVVVGVVVLTNAAMTLLLVSSLGPSAAAYGLVSSQAVGMVCYILLAKWKFQTSLGAFFWPQRSVHVQSKSDE